MANLFDIKTIPKEKKKVQHKGKIIVSNGNYADSVTDYKTGESLGGREFISVDFQGFNEGYSSTYLTEMEAQKHALSLKNKHEESGEYSRVEIIDERKNHKRFNYFLDEWKAKIQKICDDKGEEVEMWYDTSAPYDCEINVRLKSHRCSHNCVNFRFAHGILEAYDSHFGGGTTFCKKPHMSRIDEIEVVEKVMEQVFNKECSNSSWEEDSDGKSYPKRNHNVNEFGWLKKHINGLPIDDEEEEEEADVNVPRDENGWIIDE